MSWQPLELTLLVAGLVLAVPAGYLALLSLLALPGRRHTVQMRGRPRFAVLVPAHNEASTIGRLLRSLEETHYPRDDWQAFVVADACNDGSAAIARMHGATVWERGDGGQGKGQAVAWLVERVLASDARFDAAMMIDADCTVSPNAFAALAAQLDRGGRAIQLDYRMQATGSGSTSLRELAFALHNTVRSLGRSRLGASCPLLGSGMCFTKDLLTEHGWTAFGLTEDREQGYALLRAGVRVDFVLEARVTSEAPSSQRAARSQHDRWERGRLRLAMCGLGLVAASLRRREARLLDAALDAATPPLAVLSTAAVAIAGLSFGLQAWPAALGGAFVVSALLVHVLAGMIVLRAPSSAYRSLALAPVYALWKLGVYTQALVTPSRRRWVRTPRPQGD